MDTQQLRHKRKQTQNDITERLLEFQRETGAKITDVSIKKRDEDDESTLFRVELEVDAP